MLTYFAYDWIVPLPLCLPKSSLLFKAQIKCLLILEVFFNKLTEKDAL